MKPFLSRDSEARAWKKVKNSANEAYQVMGMMRERGLEGAASRVTRIVYPAFPLQSRSSFPELGSALSSAQGSPGLGHILSFWQ